LVNLFQISSWSSEKKYLNSLEYREGLKFSVGSMFVSELSPIMLRICFWNVSEENFFLYSKISSCLLSFGHVQWVVRQKMVDIFLQDGREVDGINTDINLGGSRSASLLWYISP